MAVDPGTRIGPYEISSLIGSGGMGEVYRASDPRLRRDVAIKILPAAFAGDADRLRRFEQEALAAAALNHPNILAIYDVGTVGGAPYVVAELLDGRTLRGEIDETRRLPVRRALDYAQQIARGLAAAHARGIVHRDLKPDNLFITGDGQVKILDFGLAKLMEAEPRAAGSILPTTPAGTAVGVVLGTMGYMAPEQVRGIGADHRSDIFSFGAVLYEMLTGQRAFGGTTAADNASAILRDDPPPIERRAGDVPPAVGRIVNRCLEKLPERRFQSASDLGFALEAASTDSALGPHVNSGAAATTRSGGSTFSKLVAGVALLASAALALSLPSTIQHFRERPADAPIVRFPLTLSSNVISDPVQRGLFEVSPDGRSIAFVDRTPAGTAVWLHPLDSLVAHMLPGTEGANGVPFWSPDSRRVGFFAGARLKTIDIARRVSQTVCDVPAVSAAGGGGANLQRRGTWNSSGDIVFSLDGRQPLFRVSETGGQRTPITTLDADRQEIRHVSPQFLPDGRHFIYRRLGDKRESSGTYVGVLDGGTPTRLMDIESRVAFSSTGHLLFIRDRTLMARPFDASRLVLEGEARSLSEDAIFETDTFSVSHNGVLVYGVGARTDSQFTWFDRTGREVAVVGEPGGYGNFELSPDGTRVAVGRRDPQSGASNIWVIDLIRGTLTRVTSTTDRDNSPVWSPDGRRIAFHRSTGTSPSQGPRILTVSAAGGEEMEIARDNVGPLDDWSPDGKFITYNRSPSLMALPLAGDRKAFPYVQTAGASVDEAHFSPDGRWIAYNSSESGTWQLYVSLFLEAAERLQISVNGGSEGRWRADGKELFYFSLSGQMMAVEVTLEPRFTASVPRVLFQTDVNVNPLTDFYAVSADGQRFLIQKPLSDRARSPLTVVLNWPQSLER